LLWNNCFWKTKQGLMQKFMTGYYFWNTKQAWHKHPFCYHFLECQNVCKALWLCWSFLLLCWSVLLLFVGSFLCDLDHFLFLQDSLGLSFAGDGGGEG
jgi:hypothetical protein